MKRLIVFITAAVLICSVLPAYAAEIKYTAVSSPQITSFETSSEAEDISYKLKVKSEGHLAEAARTAIYDGLIARGFTHEQIAATQAYLIDRTVNSVEMSVNYGEWFTVRNIYADKDSAGEISIDLSYISDILPAVGRRYPNLNRLNDGFTFSLRLRTASENYTPDFEGTLFVCTPPGEPTEEIEAPGFGYITYILPDGAENNPDNTEFFIRPLMKDIKLLPASRPGYTFDGWSQGKNSRVGKITKGTVTARLTSNWLPRTYAINYVLTTNTDYPFGNADNHKNPIKYTVGDGTVVYDLRPPVGGFNFGGWYMNPEFTGPKINKIPEDTTGDIILYAKWVSFEEEQEEIKRRKEEYVIKNGYGDMDLDGRITAADARLILRYSVNLSYIPPETVKKADFFNTGKVTASNARTALRAGVGLDCLYDILYINGVIK